MRNLIVIELLAILAAPCANLASERNEGSELAVVEDARDGNLDQGSLLEASLAMSIGGAESQDTALLDRYSRIAAKARLLTKPNAAELERARTFVQVLHAELLQGKFDANCDDVRSAFTSGDYNCVTSLILALEFCRKENLKAAAMQSGNHVWLRIGDAPACDLETTRLTTDLANQAAPSKLSDTQLLSRLLYNQARQRHALGRHDQAVQRLEWCLAIDPSFAPAERNLRIALGNWIARAAQDQRFSEATAVNAKALARFPNDVNLQQNADYLKQQWTKWLELENQHPATETIGGDENSFSIQD